MKNYSPEMTREMCEGTIHVIPQSHIDVAWLWRYDPETIHRCCKPTFTLATDNMDKYPDYTFSQSQVPLYAAMEEVYPELFAKMKKYIQEGRWEIVGGMYVEFEGGEPCGESLVRQCVMGKRYFKEKFGVEVKTGWQEDAWSHPWQLPQILKKSGITSYMFKRGHKGERLFWWQSPDGSRVLAYKPLHGNPSSSWKEFFSDQSSRYGAKDVMVRIGKGDHGGGPTAEDIEAVRKFAEEVSPNVEVKFNTFANFIETLLASSLPVPSSGRQTGQDYPVINSELGFELVGDLTNCGEIKKSNRQCENLLLTAEKFSSVASILFGFLYPQEELYEAWKKVLFNQFHDIIGGSGIPPVCEDTHRFYQIVNESGQKVLQSSLSAISKNIDTPKEAVPLAPLNKPCKTHCIRQGKRYLTGLVVFNPLSWSRTDPVEAELEFEEALQGIQLRDWKGNLIPAQIVQSQQKEGKYYVKLLFIAEDVPSFGYKTYYASPGNFASAGTLVSASKERVENEFFRVEIDPNTGCLKSLLDKLNLREILDISKKGNLLVALEDEGDSEGRFEKGNDLLAKPTGRSWDIVSDPVIEVIENGPIRARIQIKKGFQNSCFIQEVILYSKIRRVDFSLTVDWHDVHRMIKVAFPLKLENPEVAYNTAYGTIIRPADGLEYPAQKWVDLSSSGYGVSLLNNARYAHDVEGNVIRMSILRSPTEPAYNTDEGIHTLDYSIYPHSGGWREAEVMRRGYEFNYPLLPIRESQHEGKLPAESSFIEIKPSNLILEVAKKAFDAEELILRLYETCGQSCTAEITLPKPIASAAEADLMENTTGEVGLGGRVLKPQVGAYEIKTLRVLLR